MLHRLICSLAGLNPTPQTPQPPPPLRPLAAPLIPPGLEFPWVSQSLPPALAVSVPTFLKITKTFMHVSLLQTTLSCVMIPQLAMLPAFLKQLYSIASQNNMTKANIIRTVAACGTHVLLLVSHMHHIEP